MTSGDLLGEAIAELYSADPEEFTQRRGELVARAREAGQVPVAKQIAALRKPTRSAWVINQLARSDPGAASRLTALGGELRAAERSGDGTRMRELSQQRRQLIASLVRQALTVSGQPNAPAALREEITATFSAALADPQVAGQIQQGMLVRSVSRPGFGTAQAAALALVPPLPGSRQVGGGRATALPGSREAGARKGTPAQQRPSRDEPAPVSPSPRQPRHESASVGPAPGQPSRDEPGSASPRRVGPGRVGPGREALRQDRLAVAAERRAAKAAQTAALAQAEQEQRLAEARAAAQQALADADRAAVAASEDEQEQGDAVRRLEHELADARHRLRMASAEARRVEAAQHKARQALDRLGG